MSKYVSAALRSRWLKEFSPQRFLFAVVEDDWSFVKILFLSGLSLFSHDEIRSVVYLGSASILKSLYKFLVLILLKAHPSVVLLRQCIAELADNGKPPKA